MVNTVSYPTGLTVNSDGLVVRYGRAASIDATIGAPWTQGEVVQYVIDLDWRHMPVLSANEAIGQIYNGYPSAGIPVTATLVRGEFFTNNDFAGASGTVSVGLVSKLGADIGGNDCLVDAATITELNDTNAAFWTGAGGTGTNPLLTSTGIGSGAGSIATVLTATIGTNTIVYPWVSVQTTTLTAGKGKLVLYFVNQADNKGGPYAT